MSPIALLGSTVRTIQRRKRMLEILRRPGGGALRTHVISIRASTRDDQVHLLANGALNDLKFLEKIGRVQGHRAGPNGEYYWTVR